MSLIKQTISIRLWALFKVPLLFFTSPTLRVLNSKRAEASIKLGYRTKNHFNSMYMGALVAGADLVSGLLAMEIAKNKKKKVSLIFKDMSASFLKRPEADTVFVCDEGELIEKAVDAAEKTGERQNITVAVIASCPKISKDPVAQFKMTLSLKKVT